VRIQTYDPDLFEQHAPQFLPRLFKQDYGQLVPAFDDVGVGDDIAVGMDDESGTETHGGLQLNDGLGATGHVLCNRLFVPL